MEQQIIRESLSVTTRQITDDDRAIAREFNDLAYEVLERSRRVMKHGPTEERNIIMRVVLGSLSKLSQVDAKAEIDVSREALLSVMQQMTIPANVESTTPAPDLPTVDQVDEAGHPAVRP